MNHCALRAARRATLLGCASSLVLAAAVLPSRAEQQVINFMVNGGGFYDVTGAVPASTGGTGCCYSYVGPAQSGTPGHLSTPTNNHHAITFATTSSGNGAISEAKNVAHIGTQGHAVAGQVADDAYDGFGGVGLLGQNNFGGLTVTRNTEVTHGPTNGVTTPITNAFTNAGVPNAARFVETITNNTNQTISGNFAYFNNLGSDSATLYVATNNGTLAPGSPHSATGNLWVTSIQNNTSGPDPVLTTVVGNNKYTATQVQITTLGGGPYQNGDDNPVYVYPISVAPGKTVTVVLFSVLTANTNFNPAAGPNPTAAMASDIQLGGQLANLIDNNGKPIPLNSPFFVGLTPAQMATIINFDFNFITTLMPMGANINQMNVANGINNFINAGGNTTPLLGLLMLPTNQLNDALSHLSGEAAVDASKGAFSIMNEFLDLMLDPFVDGRTAGMGGGMTQFAAEPAPGFPSDVALAYTSVLKAPPGMTLKAPDLGRRWIAWSSGFGAYNKTNGDPVVGSNDVGAHDYGFVGGVDYRLTRNTSVGVALAGGGTTWSLSQALGGGRSDAFQAGVYSKTFYGPIYVAGAAAFTNHWMSTNRTAALGDLLSASFKGQSYGGRLESGYRYGMPTFGVTPYAAVQVQTFHTPSYSETDLTGGGFGLTYNAMNATDTRSELGARFDHGTILGNMPLTLRARAAWAHDWVTDPSLSAVFQTLPGSAFTVNGASAPRNSALASTGGELHMTSALSLSSKFDGEFASGSRTYSGTATMRYTW